MQAWGKRKADSARLLAQLYRVGQFRRRHGVRVDASAWLTALAFTLDSVPRHVDTADGKLPTGWVGYTEATLAIAAVSAGLVDPPESTCHSNLLLAAGPLDFDRADEQVARRRLKHGHLPMRKSRLALLLKITAEERLECHAWGLHAIDEPVEERKSRRNRERLTKQKAKRRAAGARPRDELKAAPPSDEEAGLSRSQIYARRKAEKEGRVMRRNRKRTQATKGEEQNRTVRDSSN